MIERSMIERVARALMQACYPLKIKDGDVRDVPILNLDPDFDDTPEEADPDDELCPFGQNEILALARAAITAMREPTEGMIAAGCLATTTARPSSGQT